MKTILLTLAAIFTLIGIYLSHNILLSIYVFLLEKPVWFLIIMIAVGVQIVGHIFRAKRTKLVIDQAASSSVRFQFLNLSIGYLFNALLPLRLGEIVRAYLISKRLRISLLYTFIAIVIERMSDVIFLSFIVIIGSVLIGGEVATNIALIACMAGALAGAILLFLLLLKQENKYILSIISSTSRIFNDSISNSIKFKVWSLIFGLQNFFNNSKLTRRYLYYATVSWLCYFISAFMIIIPLLSLTDISQIVITGVSPYIISLPSLSPLDSSSYYQLAQLLPIHITSDNLDLYAKVIWAVLILPMASVGIVSLIFYKVTKKVSTDSPLNSYSNKLLRYEDISQEFPAFLDTYFKGHSLSKVLHKIEVNGDLSLVRFFKGGSDAVTVLALHNNSLFVKKIVPVEYTERLRLQYKWLKKFKNKKLIVDVLGEQKTDSYYSIDLSYDPTNISMFEYVHSGSLSQSKKAIDDVWSYVFKNIYKLKKETQHVIERDEYVQDRLINKIRKALEVDDQLRAAIIGKYININGETYDNFYNILEKIKKHKQAWVDISTYRASDFIHGDMTIDNILINPITLKPFIIDPSDDNQVRGPIIDFARQAQSLVAGYEFLNNDDSFVKLEYINGLASINYQDHRSARYMQLYDYFTNEISKEYLTEAEQKTVLFHTGLLFGRMLAHRVVINPGNTLKYYAISVVLLNRFYRQYEK